MFAYTLGEEKLLRDHAFSQFLCILREADGREIFGVPARVYRILPAQNGFACDFIRHLYQIRSEHSPDAHTAFFIPNFWYSMAELFPRPGV